MYKSSLNEIFIRLEVSYFASYLYINTSFPELQDQSEMLLITAKFQLKPVDAIVTKSNPFEP